MPNHYHLTIHTLPDLLTPLSDEEIDRRWLRALPKEKRLDENWAPLELT